jgi:hypothetical protein
MNDTAGLTNEVLQALLTADDNRKRAALRVLRSDPADPPAPRVEPLLTLKDLARTLNLHPATVWRWRLPCRRIGARPRYRISEVEAYMDSPAFHERLRECQAERRRQSRPPPHFPPPGGDAGDLKRKNDPRPERT